MANTTFTDASTTTPGTTVVAAWLNDVNDTVYDILGDGTNVPATKADARTNLGLGTMATQDANAVAITGGTVVSSTITGTVAIVNGGTDAVTAEDALANLGIGPVGFMAHNNGVSQSIPYDTFTQINLSTEQFDLGGFFSAGAWTPPAGRLVTISGRVDLVFPGTNSRVFVTIYKNGVEFKRGTDMTSSIGGINGSIVSVVDNPSGTDVYTLRTYQSSSTAAAVPTAGDAFRTYFCGSRL